MCEVDDPVGMSNLRPGGGGSAENVEGVTREEWEMLRKRPSVEGYARYLTKITNEFTHFAQPGFVKYSELSPGDKVLLATTNYHDQELVNMVIDALRERGAKTVDLLVVDMGEDREFDFEDELRWDIRTDPWWTNPRWYDYQERILNYAKDNGYDMIIHGRGGPIPWTNQKGEPIPKKFSVIPWTTKEEFLSPATIFPPLLNNLINVKTWNMIFREGRGGRVKVTDPEGTELEFTLHEKYYERTLKDFRGFGPRPTLGHLFSHPTPPIIDEADTGGVVAGTTSHITRPFPPIKLHLESGKVKEVEGGGKYGDAWRELKERTDATKYPGFPSNGLFWLWEFALGTNPKTKRQSDVLMMHSGGNEIERSRSGVIHAGFGTAWRGESEVWAAQKGIPYGHLHVHLLFPTYDVIPKQGGRTIRVIDNGRLTAMDDPEVKAMASKYGDAEELLSEDWIPRIPGISSSGSYEDYARDPAAWIAKFGG